MNWEIEIKAHVDDPRKTESQILALGARPIRSYNKYDQYYQVQTPGGDVQDFRLRVDGDKAQVTFKDKDRKDGLEMNREGEFTVSDSQMFEEFLSRIGARPLIEKRKIGKAYRYMDLLLELSEVVDLGHFLEIEAIFQADQEQRDPQFIQSTETRLYKVLDKVGIPKERVETKSYTSLLREKRGLD